MDVLTVERACAECGEKLPDKVKHLLFAKQNITEIEDFGLSLVLYVLVTQ